MDFIGPTKAGDIDLSPIMRTAREDYIRRWKEGTLVRERLTRILQDKSQAQLGAHFGLMFRIILDEFESRGWDLQMLFKNVPPGLPVTKDHLKEYLYAVAGNVGDDGERKRISVMNTAEMSRHFELSRDYVAAHWYIQIPEPDPTWKHE
jgi:hypothetical protein